MLTGSSLNIVHFRDGALEVSHTNPVISTARYLLGSIIHGVELTNLIDVADLLEQRSDLLSRSQLSEVVLRNTLL